MKEHKILREIFWIIWFEKFDYYPDYGIFVKKAKIFESGEILEKEIIISIEELVFDEAFIWKLTEYIYSKIWFFVKKEFLFLFLKNNLIDFRFYFIEELAKYLKFLENKK